MTLVPRAEHSNHNNINIIPIDIFTSFETRRKDL